MVKTDIDQLLEATEDLDMDVNHLILGDFEIDWLLECTQDGSKKSYSWSNPYLLTSASNRNRFRTI